MTPYLIYQSPQLFPPVLADQQRLRIAAHKNTAHKEKLLRHEGKHMVENSLIRYRSL